MDTADGKIARLERSLARTGEMVLIERLNTDSTTGVSTVVNSVITPAWIRDSVPQDLIDNEAKDIRVVVSPTLLFVGGVGSPPEVFGIPKRDDRIVIHGSPCNVQNANPIYYGGKVVRVNMLVRG